MAKIELLREAEAFLEFTVSRLFESGLEPTILFVQASEDISVRLGRMTQLHRTLSQSVLNLIERSVDTSPIEPSLISCLFALSGFGVRISEPTSGLIENHDRLKDWHATSEHKNCGPLSVPQSNSIMSYDDTRHNDEGKSVTAHEQLPKTQETTSIRPGIWQRCAASLRNLYPYLLSNGNLQLLRGEPLTPEHRIVRLDGSTRLSDKSTVHAIRNSPNDLGFKLPPLHDSIYHPSSDFIDMGD